jgi:predicted esterase
VLTEAIGQKELPLHVLGFSQGTATLIRWVLNTEQTVQRTVLWGGDIAKDVDLASLVDRAKARPLELVIGREDEYITEADVTARRAYLDEQGINFELNRYAGGHTIEPGELQRLILPLAK